MISVYDTGQAGAWGDLSWFRQELYGCLIARADTLFELADAVLCTDGPVTSLAELSLTAEHRRGHGAFYDAVNHGRVEIDRLRVALAGLPLPRAADGRLVLTVDVSPWLRPDASTSAQRLFCHIYGRGKNQAQLIPGWPYSFIAALETGRTSWTAMLDVQRLGPADDTTAVTATQLRAVIDRLITTGHWKPGDPKILIVTDTGYDITQISVRPSQSSGDPIGAVAQRPSAAATGTCATPWHQRSPTQTRRRVRPGPSRNLAVTPAHHPHPDHPLRHGHRDQLGPAASPADPPHMLAGA